MCIRASPHIALIINVSRRTLEVCKSAEIRTEKLQVCTFVQSCAIVQNSCALNSLIYKCKHPICTNVLFIPPFIREKKNKFRKLFHVELILMIYNNLRPKIGRKRGQRFPRAPLIVGAAGVQTPGECRNGLCVSRRHGRTNRILPM